jgi:DtxR family Mn-dependent transcriptional regulator
MIVSENAQEILENLWINIEEKKSTVESDKFKDTISLKELSEEEYIKVSNGKIILTDKGHKEAMACIRRHRLAEKLMSDVFMLNKSKVHEPGCKFEHMLHKELEENICTLLGHPTECPHGRPIPPGKCCKEFKTNPEPIIKNLSDLRKGDTGIIAYIHTKDKKELQKIMAMGALPGNNIKLAQSYPSYVFQIGHSQFAIDKELAKKIFVRPKKV